jgi:Tol biopolymer transport system component
MSFLDSQAVSSRPLRFLLSAIVLAASLALGACDGGENQLAPSSTEDPIAPASEPAASEASAAADALLLSTAQRIVFTSWRQGNAETYKMDSQGTSVARLTKTTGAQERAPAWSYDNKKIAVMRKRADIGNVIHDDIWVMNADGTNGHWMRPEASPWNLWDPTWSPDGSRLLLTMSLSGYVYLATMTVADGQVTLLHPVGGGILGHQPQYDRTGQKIVYVNTYTKTVDQVNADGSNHKVLATTTTLPNRPTFSPDGKKIAYSKMIPGTLNEEIFVKNLGTNVTTRLTYSSSIDFEPTWSPDGTKIAFASRRSGQYQVWVMSATGGSPVRITHTSTMEAEPFWSH